ncbi:MAG: deoxyribodipyrimidine photo-lyase [Paracoccaceae bacterium]
MEHRPQVWASYRDGLRDDLAGLAAAPARDRAVAVAEAGATGIDCFDAWASELTNTGYLHNHARMWFASIWIFTLGLPWRIGADFFLRHLLDGDPASNTLGWRWVAGLHTRGKAYQALASNIATFTDGRFAPLPGDLAAEALGREHTEPDGLPPVQPLRTPQAPRPGPPTALLITEDGCRVAAFDLAGLDLRAVATPHASHLRFARPMAEGVARFEAGALADAAARAGGAVTALRAGAPADLADWARRAGATRIAAAYTPECPARDWLRAAAPHLAAHGIAYAEWRRDWDAAIWPHATAGFFKVKRQIPRILSPLIA